QSGNECDAGVEAGNESGAEHVDDDHADARAQHEDADVGAAVRELACEEHFQRSGEAHRHAAGCHQWQKPSRLDGHQPGIDVSVVSNGSRTISAISRPYAASPIRLIGWLVSSRMRRTPR